MISDSYADNAMHPVMTTGNGRGISGVAPVFNVKDAAYGASLNGVDDDTTAFTAAITAAAASGGVVFHPGGTALVTGNLGGALSNVTIQGAGRFVSIIKLADDSNTHVFDITGNNWTFRDLGIDGNDAGNSSGHGIRISGDHHTLDTLYIHDTVGYGIGCAQGDSTSLRYATFANLYIKNAGTDGIDIKDKASTNTANRISNVFVDGFDIAAGGGSAGVDIRGAAHLANITVDGDSTNGSGIRFRETSPSTGPLGGFQSSLTNARVIGDDTTSMYGITVNAQGVSVSNAYVNNIWRAFGAGVDAAQVSFVNCVAEDANSRGFEISTTSNEEVVLQGCTGLDCATSFYVTSNDVTLIGCASRDATTAGFDVRGDRVQIRGGRVTAAAGTAVSINASAGGTQITGLDFSQQSGGTVLSNSGTTTFVRDCVGVTDIVPTRPFARIDAQRSLVDDNSVQPLFPTTGDALTVIAGETYRFRCMGRVIKGANSVDVSFLLGGDATFTTINYVVIASNTAAGSLGTATTGIGVAATAKSITAASVSTNARWIIDGEFEINAAGTIIPSVQFGGVTGATPTVELGTFFECWPLGTNPVTTIGPWA
jgi:hypothetical protein